jgi:hypothetical protein
MNACAYCTHQRLLCIELPHYPQLVNARGVSRLFDKHLPSPRNFQRYFIEETLANRIKTHVETSLSAIEFLASMFNQHTIYK